MSLNLTMFQVVHASLVVTQQQNGTSGGRAGIQSESPEPSSLRQIQNIAGESSTEFTESLSAQPGRVWTGVDHHRVEHGEAT